MLKAKNKLGLVLFPAFDWAISPTHPEREERLLYTQDQIFEEGVEDIEGIKFYNPEISTIKDIERVHFCFPSVKDRLKEAHFISSGGAITAFKAVMDKKVDKAFALVRPPGHHAHRIVYGDRGFCVVNNEAVMLEKIRKEYGPLRVAIVDTDCHHGDGTQDIYWNDKETLFISLHQDGKTLYPGTGFIDELGGPAAYGYNINIPLPPGTGDEGFMYVLDNLVLPILAEFKPDIIINSAGQDNHYSDPLTNMNFSAQGYAKLNEKLNPDIAVLEGGYSIEGALPYINLGIILAMAGLDYSRVKEPDYDKSKTAQSQKTTDYIVDLTNIIYKNWKNKDLLKDKKFKGLKSFIKPQRIYFDTDGITENQIQEYKICNDCSGLNTIKSSSDRGDSILAITIPRDGCINCVNEGKDLFEKANLKKYTKVFLQNRVEDIYKSK